MYWPTESKMERGRFRACTGMRYALFNPILEGLARECRIKMTVGKQGDLISNRAIGLQGKAKHK